MREIKTFCFDGAPMYETKSAIEETKKRDGTEIIATMQRDISVGGQSTIVGTIVSEPRATKK